MVIAAGAIAGERPDEALCMVCAVHGETETEKVKAQSPHDGTTYYFCSEKCKAEFDTDPLAYIPPQLPRPAPDIVVETLDGQDVTADEFDGKVVLVDFWATWCKPCRKSMPELQRLYDEHADDGFTIMGISIDEEKDRTKRVSKYLDKYDISYPIYADAKATPAWLTYRVKAVPAMFLIDREGQIVRQWLGTVDHEDVAADVARLVETAPEHDVGRYVDDNVIVSSQLPDIRIRVDDAFAYVGRFPFDIRDVATGERLVFVDALDGAVRRLFVAQFEHFLPDNDEWYRYRFDDAMTLGNHRFRQNTYAYSNDAAAREDPQGEGVLMATFLEEKGYRLEDELMMSRFVTVAGEAKKHELILFYIENVSTSGYELSAFYDDSGNDTENWIRISRGLTARSLEHFAVLQ